MCEDGLRFELGAFLSKFPNRFQKIPGFSMRVSWSQVCKRLQVWQVWNCGVKLHDLLQNSANSHLILALTITHTSQNILVTEIIHAPNNCAAFRSLEGTRPATIYLAYFPRNHLPTWGGGNPIKLALKLATKYPKQGASENSSKLIKYYLFIVQSNVKY